MRIKISGGSGNMSAALVSISNITGVLQSFQQALNPNYATASIMQQHLPFLTATKPGPKLLTAQSHNCNKSPDAPSQQVSPGSTLSTPLRNISKPSSNSLWILSVPCAGSLFQQRAAAVSALLPSATTRHSAAYAADSGWRFVVRTECQQTIECNMAS